MRRSTNSPHPFPWFRKSRRKREPFKDTPKAEKQRVLGFDIECKPNQTRTDNPCPFAVGDFHQAFFLFRLFPVAETWTPRRDFGKPRNHQDGSCGQRRPPNLNKIEELKLPDSSLAHWQISKSNKPVCNLTAIFFKQRLSKSAQLSNCKNAPLLLPRQYAATDAWIS